MTEAVFQKCLAFTASFEGIKFTDDPNDAGGPTKYGITQEIYDQYRNMNHKAKQSVSKILKDEAVDIYRQIFWTPSYAPLFEYPLALALFDTQVQFNPATKVMLVNNALGLFATTSSVTRLEALKQLTTLEEQVKVASAIARNRYAFRSTVCMKYPTQLKFKDGWQRRDMALLQQIQLYSNTANLKNFAIRIWTYCKKSIGLR